MINRVRPNPSDDPFKKGKAGKSEGLSDEDRKVEKTREVDPEEKKRRQFRKHLESSEKKEVESKEKAPSPYDTKFYDKGPVESAPVEKTPPPLQKEEKSHEKRTSPKLEEVTEKAPPAKDQYPIESKATKTSEHLYPKEEERIEQKKFNKEHKTPSGELKNEKEKKNDIPSLPAAPEVPQAVMQRAIEITHDLRINNEIAPLFQQMVGSMIVMSSQDGIMQTEITLDNPEFENSPFFGSTILLEKYSTAPDSFNIRLTGNPEAVAMFNGNIDILMESFRKGNFNFRVGRLEAAYQAHRPLFRRKKGTSGKDIDQGMEER